ncbi:hypothetical protein GGR51DRAFT_533824 [Nemania sp. FL0031]|nr:hypothetical protein GGR51DRAFT_533824 [Nemania sp. FL0031]
MVMIPTKCVALPFAWLLSSPTHPHLGYNCDIEKAYPKKKLKQCAKSSPLGDFKRRTSASEEGWLGWLPKCGVPARRE